MKVEEEPIESILLLEQEEHVADISCGALFTIALTNKGRLFGCGYQGCSLPDSGSPDDYMEKAKFKAIEIEAKIVRISCGLSGAGALSREGHVYIWGRFGKLVYNVPKKLSSKPAEDISSRQEEERYAEVRVGDEFIAVLTVKGEVLTFGENIDNQLGADADNPSFRASLERVQSVPLFKSIEVGRNHCLALSGNNELYGWGSNRYNQIGVS